MTLASLEPPYTRSLPTPWLPRREALTEGPRLVRTRLMGRWHRPRSGTRGPFHDGTVRTCLHLWCGPSVALERALAVDEVPVGERLCGTCEGRAVGAGHPAIAGEPVVPLLHQPVSSRPPPARCPSRLLPESRVARLPDGVFPCPVCGVAARLRAAGGWSNPHVVVEGHPPGSGLMPPCPFHRWDQLTLDDQGRARCSCER